jgi:hypothetical protein
MSEGHSTEVVITAPHAPSAKVPLVADGEVLAIVPKDLDQAWRYAEMVCKAGLAPSSYDEDPRKVVIGVLTSLELGVPPMQGLKGIAIINGRPTVWGDLAMALIQSKGVVQNTEQNFTGEPDSDEYTAHYLIWRRGQENPYEGHFSVKDAKRAGLWGNARKRPWIEYPTRMLLMRARAFALRDGFSDCLCGLAITEEVRDMPEPPKQAPKDFLDDDVPAQTVAEPQLFDSTEERKPEKVA